MSKRFLILAVALLCLLALPAAALGHGPERAKIDPSVQAAARRHGGSQACRCIVYGDSQAPQRRACPTASRPRRTARGDRRRVPRTSPPTRSRPWPATIPSRTSSPTTPCTAIDYQSSPRHHQLAIGLGKCRAPERRRPRRPRRRGRGAGQRHRDQHRPRRRPAASSGWKDFVNGKRNLYDDAGHGTFVAGLIAGDGPPRCRWNRAATPPCSTAAWRPTPSIVAHQGPGQPRPGPRVHHDRRHRLGHRLTRTSTTSAC